MDRETYEQLDRIEEKTDLLVQAMTTLMSTTMETGRQEEEKESEEGEQELRQPKGEEETYDQDDN